MEDVVHALDIISYLSLCKSQRCHQPYMQLFIIVDRGKRYDWKVLIKVITSKF